MNKITLHALNSDLQGKRWEFDEKTLLIAGREDDCGLRVPEECNGVSRQHCQFEINPPHIAVRDLGSLNGTYLNGECIGSRDVAAHHSASLPLHPLKQHDEVKLGQTGLVLRVEIIDARPRCVRCGNVTETGGAQCAKCNRDILLKEAHREPVIYQLRKYEAFEKLPGAGSSQVFRARDERGQLVIVKAISFRDVEKAGRVEALLREMHIMHALQHPHMVQIIESWRDDEKAMLFIVMEHCNGGSLHDLATAYHRRTGAWLPSHIAVPLIIQALDGLHYAHHEVVLTHEPKQNGEHPRGVVHRDIKPANLILSFVSAVTNNSSPTIVEALLHNGSNAAAWLAKNVVVKVGDFGLSKSYLRAGQSHLTQGADSYGTAPFMSRQQLLDYRFVRPAVDVWSMAATLYWLLSGATPRDFPKGVETHIPMKKPATPLLQRNATVPVALAALVDAALLENEKGSAAPAHLQTARGFQSALRSVLASL